MWTRMNGEWMGRGANDEKLITAHHIVARRVFGGVSGGRRGRRAGCPLNSLDYMGVSRSRAPRTEWILGMVLRLFRVIYHRWALSLPPLPSLFLSRFLSPLHLFFSFSVPLSFNGGPYGEVCFVCACSAPLRDNYGAPLRRVISSRMVALKWLVGD